MNYRFVRQLMVASTLMAAASTQAAMQVFALEPEWAALVQEIGGDNVSAHSATTALQDPHYIQARPSLIARMRKAEEAALASCAPLNSHNALNS